MNLTTQTFLLPSSPPISWKEKREGLRVPDQQTLAVVPLVPPCAGGLLRDEVLEDGDLASRDEEGGLLSFLAAELPLPRVAAEAEPDTLLATGAVVGLRDAKENK